jgi:hypothetical protein
MIVECGILSGETRLKENWSWAGTRNVCTLCRTIKLRIEEEGSGGYKEMSSKLSDQ